MSKQANTAEKATDDVPTDDQSPLDAFTSDDDDEWIDPIAMDVFGMPFDEWHARACENLGIEHEEADR
jgi:hypothetical protein